MTSYKDSGVDLEGADRHVANIGPLVTSTWGKQVIGGFGGFAAGVELPPGYKKPVLMMSTDGVGTKLELARIANHWDGVGFDLVAMCVDDLAVVGAKPIGFVDYMAVGSLKPERDTAVVASVAKACAAVDCPLVGGETAEHPGVMDVDAIDLAGAVVGIVEKGREITGAGIEAGDAIVGIASPNLRSNGFSLIRRIVGDTDLNLPFPGEDATYAEVLLRPSVLYSNGVLAAIEAGGVRGAAHITGGGIPGNLIRPIPSDFGAVVDLSSWETPNVFKAIQEMGSVSPDSMVETFNLGIGFCLFVNQTQVESTVTLLKEHGHSSLQIGEVTTGPHRVEFV